MSEPEVVSALYALAAENDVPANCSLACHASAEVHGSPWTVSGMVDDRRFETGSGKTIAEAVDKFNALRPPSPAERIAQLRAEADRLERELSNL